jgi:GntR family transcriptional regulator
MSTNQYAAIYRINPATAAKAFQELVDEGVIYKKRGIGMFVDLGARKALLGQHRKRFFTDAVDPMIAQAEAIRIPLEDVVAHIERRRSTT